MWVTQTYLAGTDSDAKLFVYYVFEEYNSDQAELTERISTELGKIGREFGGSVSLFVPNPEYAVDIQGELRGIEELWRSMQGKLPGLLITTSNLRSFDPASGECHLVPLSGISPSEVAEVIAGVRRLLSSQLEWMYQNPRDPDRHGDDGDGIVRRFKDAASLELPIIPSFIKIDLKKLFKKRKR